VVLVAPIERAWQFRELIRAILSRELASRFRGSIFGWAWAVASPLVMMLAYTVIFSGVIVISRINQPISFSDRALVVFTGMTVFGLFTELLYRAPALLHEHAGFIKRSIFPTEALAWIAVLRALVYAGISFGVLIAFELLIKREIPSTVLLAPIIILPMVLLLLGSTWFLMALGAFTRDVTHLMATIVPLFMWITPVFYRMDDVPAPMRSLMYFNIMGDYITMFRGLVLTGALPSPTLFATCAGISYVVFILGYVFFTRYKSIIVDVI
jgi:homopolymeric O-antigen transport system permease protein